MEIKNKIKKVTKDGIEWLDYNREEIFVGMCIFTSAIIAGSICANTGKLVGYLKGYSDGITDGHGACLDTLITLVNNTNELPK